MMKQLSSDATAQNQDADNDDGGKWSDYFSSHPASQKRVDRFREASPKHHH